MKKTGKEIIIEELAKDTETNKKVDEAVEYFKREKERLDKETIHIPVRDLDEEEQKSLSDIYHNNDSYDDFMAEALENGYSEYDANVYFEDLTNKYGQ